MRDRIKTIIDIKANGCQADFASALGWTPQYLCNLMRRDSMGLQPILTILQHYPDIDARWLLFGEGVPIRRESLLTNILGILDYERYVPYMTEDEQIYYAQCIAQRGIPHFTDGRLAELRARADYEERKRQDYYRQSINKSRCRTKKANS